MEPSVCRHCGKAYGSKSGLRQHELSHAKVGPHMCCGKIFYSQANLTRHKCNVHEEEKAFACNQCDKNFAIKADLERHRKREKKEFKFTCDMCGEKLYRMCMVIELYTPESCLVICYTRPLEGFYFVPRHSC